MVSAGTFKVAASITEPTDFVAYADMDACMEGYVDVSGDGTVCEEKHYECPAITVKVSNGEAMDFGWRIREMRLYGDAECSPESEVAPGTASIYPVSTPNMVPGDPKTIAPYSHPREIVRALQ